MLISEIINEDRQKVVNMYHGTSSVFLSSIRKFGLDPNPKPIRKPGDPHPLQIRKLGLGPTPTQKSWGNNDKTWASYDGGVYLSSERQIAEVAAIDAVGNYGGEPIVITVQYFLGSAGLDEDHANDILIKSFFNSKNVNEFIEIVTNEFNSEFKINYPKNNYKDLVDLYNLIELRYKEWVKDDPDPQGLFPRANSNYWTPSNLAYAMHTDADNADVIMAYQPYRSIVKKIIDKAKVFNVKGSKSDYFNLPKEINIRVTRPIKFKGKTRIIKIEKSRPNL